MASRTELLEQQRRERARAAQQEWANRRVVDPDAEDRSPVVVSKPIPPQSSIAPVEDDVSEFEAEEFFPPVSSDRKMNPASWESALDDPEVDPGTYRNRSHYVEDSAFARYAAAVFWTSRNPDINDAPENASAGVNSFLMKEAARLERKYNEGRPFRATPYQVSRAKKNLKKAK